MRLLEKNMKFSPGGSLEVRKLLWGYKQEVASLFADVGAPDVIMGKVCTFLFQLRYAR